MKSIIVIFVFLALLIVGRFIFSEKKVVDKEIEQSEAKKNSIQSPICKYS